MLEGQPISFCFFHGLPFYDYPLEEQKLRSYREFTNLLRKKSRLDIHKMSTGDNEIIRSYNFELEKSHIWNRYFQYNANFDGQVVIHGHTPIRSEMSIYFDSKSQKQFEKIFVKYDTKLYLFLRFLDLKMLDIVKANFNMIIMIIKSYNTINQTILMELK